jgi:hypothetical protein
MNTTCLRLSAVCTGLLLCLSANVAVAQEAGKATLTLRPHCDEPKERQNACPAFDVENPTTLKTAALEEGDTLDIDIVIENPEKMPISSVRAWLAFDPKIFDGQDIQITSLFPVITPGEADFSDEGYVQIGVKADDAARPADDIIPVARITMLLKGNPTGGKTPIAFHDLKPGIDGHTTVTSIVDGTEKNVLPAILGQLLVIAKGSLASTVSGASATSQSNSQGSTASMTPLATTSASDVSSAAAPAGGRSAFVLLQTQNVRATTQGTSVFVAWDALNAPDLTAYNIYYSAESGRYVHRKTIAKDSVSATIAGLEKGKQVFLAVRAINTAGEENSFSREVSVTVGNPATSTAPLRLQGDTNIPVRTPTKIASVPRPPREVPGEAGLPSWLAFVLMTSAGIGTVLAARRQRTALSSPR